MYVYVCMSVQGCNSHTENAFCLWRYHQPILIGGSRSLNPRKCPRKTVHRHLCEQRIDHDLARMFFERKEARGGDKNPARLRPSTAPASKSPSAKGEWSGCDKSGDSIGDTSGYDNVCQEVAGNGCFSDRE